MLLDSSWGTHNEQKLTVKAWEIGIFVVETTTLDNISIWGIKSNLPRSVWRIRIVLSNSKSVDGSEIRLNTWDSR